MPDFILERRVRDLEQVNRLQAEMIAELADRVRDLESRRHSDLEEIRELVNRGLHS